MLHKTCYKRMAHGPYLKNIYEAVLKKKKKKKNQSMHKHKTIFRRFSSFKTALVKKAYIKLGNTGVVHHSG